MISDLRVIDEPLDKWICRTCGLVSRREPPPHELYTSGYALYAHAPGAPRETARQRAYAAWIASQSGAPPRRVLDVGCGNGSLLTALMREWPATQMSGVDPSPESIAHARAAGIDARAGRRGDVAASVDMVISVNVIEHTPDPAAFIEDALAALVEDGELVLICPDAQHPWTELLIADHVWSFGPRHLIRLLENADLAVVSTSSAPAELGPLIMVRAARRQRAKERMPSAPSAADGAGEKCRYLDAWRRMDATLRERAPEGTLICFGIGEAAALLRAYTPDTWSRVDWCTADDPERPTFGDLPVETYPGMAPSHILLGVRPPAQASVAARLLGDGHSVIRWDDLVAA